jgi:hypothetical protein
MEELGERFDVIGNRSFLWIQDKLKDPTYPTMVRECQ